MEPSCLPLYRYSLVVELNRSSDLLLKDVNRVALYTGLLGALGMFIVANFQETAVIQIHLTGAFMCFGFGCLYMLLQTWVSYRMHPLFVNRRIAYIRGSIALLSSICFVLGISQTRVPIRIGVLSAVVLGVMASNTFHKYFPDVPSPRPWRQHNPPLPVGSNTREPSTRHAFRDTICTAFRRSPSGPVPSSTWASFCPTRGTSRRSAFSWASNRWLPTWTIARFGTRPPILHRPEPAKSGT